MAIVHVQILFESVVVGVLALAALHDLATRTIPDAIAIIVATIGVTSRILAHNLPLAFLAAVIVFSLSTLAFARGLMGGGDVKLLGAVALIVSPAQAPALVLTIALAGGVLSLLYLALGFLVSVPAALRPATMLARFVRAELWRIRRRGPLPYGVAIVAGTILTLAGAAA